MQARFLLGPAGSGKTFRCLAEIRAELLAAPDGPPLILLAPKQTTFQLERQLLGWDEIAEGRARHSVRADGGQRTARPTLHGYTRLRILSFERLAQFVLDELRIAPPQLLAEEGRVMVLRALLQRHAGKLRLFGKSARRPGFAQQLSRLLAELQQHQFTPAKLRALPQREKLSPELQDKLHDLALLLEAYAGWLAENKLQDDNHSLEAATTALRDEFKIQNSKFKIANLWLDGFAEMTPQELDLLAAVVPHCDRATLAFCLEAEPRTETSWLSLWSAVGHSFRECHARHDALADVKTAVEVLPRDPAASRFAASADLRHLEEYWSRPTPNSQLPSAISLVSCANPEAEAVLAAREILKLVRGGGRFREAAVLVRSFDGYQRPLERVFRRYGIPFFLDQRESVAHHPLAELTRSALRTVSFDWTHEDWFGALKCGFAPVAEADIDRLENEALARGWRGRTWLEPLQIPDKPEQAEWCERRRLKLVPPFTALAEQLAESARKPTGRQLSAALREFWSAMDAEAHLTEWADAAQKLSAKSRQPAAVHTTVWEQMNGWLKNVELAFADEALLLRDWLPILEAGLANLSVGVIPPALDQVLIGAIDRSRNPELKLALVLGLNEGVFPAAPATPTLLTDADRDELGASGAAVGPNLHDRLARERYYGYIACTRASERLVLTCAERDADGGPLNPSAFVAHLRRLFPSLEVELDVRPHPGPLPQERENHSQPPGDSEDQETATAKAFSEFSSDATNVSLSPGERAGVRADEKSNLHSSVEWNSIQHVSELVPPLLRGEVRASSALASLPQIADVLNRWQQWQTLSGPERLKLSPAAAAALYGNELKTSVSALEAFAGCPFQFFTRYGLRADERKLFEADPRQTGSFQHEILSRFHLELQAEGKRWRDITPQVARERIAAIGAEAMATFGGGLFEADEKSRFLARTLIGQLQDFIAVLVGWMSQYEFDPQAVELSFGLKDSDPSAWRLDLGEGRALLLRGKIDRVDLCRTADDAAALAVVVDYKSGGAKLDPVLLHHGLQLQLLAYLGALRHLTEPKAVLGVNRIEPAGVFYVPLRAKAAGGNTRADVLGEAADEGGKVYQHTGRFDAAALEKFDNRHAAKGDQFKYSKNKGGEFSKTGNEAMPTEEFRQLLDQIEADLRRHGTNIFAGEVAARPYRKGNEKACDWCPCVSVCRFDAWVNPFNVLRKPAEPEVAATAGEKPT